MDYDMTGARGVPPLEGAASGAPPRRLSQIFRELAVGAQEPISIGRIRDEMGDRSFAALLVLFAAFNLLPLPPGATLVFALPLILVSAQMTLGYEKAWLPRRLLDKSVSPERFRRSADRLIPYLEWLEEMVRPRRWPFSNGTADRVIGTVALILSIAVFLPIPLGNWLPAFSIAVMGLAFSERDGIVLAVGFVLGLASLAVIGAVVGAAGVLASAVFGIHF